MRETSSLAIRKHATALAAQVCQGALPTGTTLLSYIMVFETYLNEGSSAAAEALGWDIVDREPVSLAEIRASLSVTLGGKA